MSEPNHVTLKVLEAQYGELCRRIEEIRADVRAEEAETRQAMQAGFARMDTRYNSLDGRVRAVEGEQQAAKERLSTWRAVVPLLSGIAAGIGSWSKDLLQLFK